MGLALGLLAVMAGLLAASETAAQAVREGLALCGGSVIPALFPFLVVSTLLLRLGFGELAAPWLAGLIEPLFRVDGVGSSALLLGLVGGYPIGPRTTAELYRQDEIALQIRMASMVNESVKEGGGNNLIVVPSSFSEGFNAGTMKDVQDLFKKHA